MRTFFGFHVQTVSLSVTYLDQFLSRRAINVRNSSVVIQRRVLPPLKCAVSMIFVAGVISRRREDHGPFGYYL